MNKNFLFNKKNLYLALSLVAILLSAKYIFNFQVLTTYERIDNPRGCKYYMTMESMLANYPLLSFDKANTRYIKNKIVQFEADLQKRSSNPVTTAYAKNYYGVLAKLNLSSIKQVSGSRKLIALAKQTYRNMDQFYLDEQLFCQNPLYDTVHMTAVRQLLYYHLGGLYYDLFPNVHIRVESAVNKWVEAGVFPGFFVNNQTTSLDTRFLVGIPLLTALYVIPGYDFKTFGSGSALVPWDNIGSVEVTNEKFRKIFDIAGIDAFTVARSELSSPVQHATILKNKSVVGETMPDYITYWNDNSYGMAYLANQITYVDQNEILKLEHAIKKYFAKPQTQDHNQFVLATQTLDEKLYNLKEKHDILLEAKLPITTATIIQQAAGTVDIRGIVGERAFFVADCLREQCTFVANITASPGWHIFVNRHEQSIQRANFAFISTTIPEGKDTIWLIYAPFTTLLSYLISILFLMLISWKSIQ